MCILGVWDNGVWGPEQMAAHAISFHLQWSWRERCWSSPEWRGHVTLAPKRYPGNTNHTHGVRKLHCPCGLGGLPHNGPDCWAWKGNKLLLHRIDWDCVGVTQFPCCPLKEAALLSLSPAVQLRCQQWLFLCVCRLLKADPNLTSVGGQAQTMSTGISQL